MALQNTVLGTVTSFLTSRNALFLVCGWIAYKLLLALWNLSPFHPLSHIPGPKLATATYLPEFWYDVVKFGRYTKEIQKMHEVYGTLYTQGRENISNKNKVQLFASIQMKYTVMMLSLSTKSTQESAESVTSRCIKSAVRRKKTPFVIPIFLLPDSRISCYLVWKTRFLRPPIMTTIAYAVLR